MNKIKSTVIMLAVTSVILSVTATRAANPCPSPCVLQAPVCGGGPRLCRRLSEVFGDVGAPSGWKRDPGATSCGSTIGGLLPRQCGQPKIWDATCP